MGIRKLNICFTSDLHGYIYPTDYRGREEKNIGLFKCANRFLRDGNSLVIDGGDALQGSPFGAFCHDVLGRAETLAEIMNRCGYDYVTLGNHDFNFGLDYLGSYLQALKARCVCENVRGGDGAALFPAQVHVLKNGLRVGVAGIVTDHVNIWERPEHLQGVSITDPFAAAKEALNKLRGQADVTVCVYHGGFEQDLETGRTLTDSTENIACKICRELNFDILLTGHQHMSVPGRLLHDTFVVQPSDNGREFVQISVELGENGEKTITSRSIPAGGDCDQALLREFSPVERGAQSWLDEIVGSLEEPLLPGEPLHMASRGSRLADLFNTVQLWASQARLSATSLANGIAGLPQTVRRRDLLTAYPYSNTLTVLKITGATLRRAMERSAAYFSYGPQGELRVSEDFLQPKVEHYNYDYYAGVDYAFDVSRPVGSRVVKLEYQGRPVEAEDSFSICLNSYRASGTGGYECYKGCPVEREINMEMSDLLLEYFKLHKDDFLLPTSRFSVK